ncbi:probable 4-coumarate--CoA ligase 1, partial [Galendromus occidentalis]|uniref:Probable 4-coumarate--CoA ligase 1 n=1 Tax=Galendromus occidentalis TaxID=34638 RepID=A0AAJ6QQA3_9ACAR
QNGELYCKAPSVALGYYRNEKATAETFKDGWLLTGDLAFRDDEGRVVIVDRLKQMIKCMDSQVAPADLEALLSRDEDVSEVVVGGVPHEKFGEAAVAFVVPKRFSDLQHLREKLIEAVKSKCAFHKHLHGGLFFLRSIPETDSGKFSRRDVVKLHLDQQIEYLD